MSGGEGQDRRARWLRARAWVAAGLAAAMGFSVSAHAGAVSNFPASCSAGRIVYADSALRIFAPAGKQLRLKVCARGNRAPIAVKLPAGVTAIGPARRFGTVIGVVATRAVDGKDAAAILQIRRTGAVATPVLVAPDVFGGERVVDLALRSGSPYVALALASGEIRLVQIDENGIGTAAGLARPFRLQRGTLALDIAKHRVAWKDRSGDRGGAPLLPDGCSFAGEDLPASTPEVRIAKTVGDSVYACARATGIVSELWPAGVGPRVSTDPISASKIKVAGTHVAYTLLGVADPDAFFVYFTVLDAATSIDREIPVDADKFGDSRISEFVLAPDGAVAYVEGLDGGGGPCPSLPQTPGRAPIVRGLVAVDAQGQRTLDCQTDPGQATPTGPYVDSITALSLDGRTISWQSLGAPRTDTLR